LAEITKEKANVWYEVGLSDTSDRKIIFICEQGTPLPFDVIHRKVIFYSTNSISDFEVLKKGLQKH
jgi:hypothetical protein